MKTPRFYSLYIFHYTLAFSVLCALNAQSAPSPKEHFGFNIGDDYRLANFTQTDIWFRKLAAASDRVHYVDMGATEEGRRQPMLIVSSPANLAKLDRYKAIAKELALAENPDPARARALASEGRAVVWISGGLHANETLGSHQLIETAWQLATRDDPETLHILDNVIVLLVHANPDGQELIANWYNRRPDPKTRVSLVPLAEGPQDTPPRLFHKYIGHENNRDFFMNNMRETANINRQLYIEWFPQIVLDTHQTAPRGAIVGTAPYRDPFDHHTDPLVVRQTEVVGAAMHSRWIAENMPGTISRGGATTPAWSGWASAYSAWGNGGLTKTVLFHNMIGILTETAGSPTPMHIRLTPDGQVFNSDLPMPVAPQLWRFRRSIEYSLTGNYAILDHAARHRDQLLLNIYRMGRNSIERGSRDTWTRKLSQVEDMKAAAAHDAAEKARAAGNKPPPAPPSFTAMDTSYFAMLQRPGQRDPRAFIITADPTRQHDRAAVAKFINTLSLGGITIHKAAAPFNANGKNYPKDTYVLKAAQAFRPHLLSMFEPQEYPADFFTNPAARNTAPYDTAGWTLAFQMGIAFDRILDALPDDLPLERLPHGVIVAPPPGAIVVAGRARSPSAPGIANDNLDSGGFGETAGYLISHRPNRSFTLINRLLKAGADIFWLHNNDTAATSASSNNPKSAIQNPQSTIAPGTLYIPATPASTPIVARAVTEFGLDAFALSTPPATSPSTSGRGAGGEGLPQAIKLAPTRIALWDRYGGSPSSGWIRWLLEQYEYAFDLIYAQQIDEASSLRERYDVIIFPHGAIPSPMQIAKTASLPKTDNIPGDFHHMLGAVNAEKTIPALKRFLERGGSIVTIGDSTNFVYHLGLPVRNVLVIKLPDGKQRSITREEFSIPGSIVRAEFDPAVPLAWGMDRTAPVFFFRNPAFTLAPEAAARGVRPVAWLGKGDYLMSGLAVDKRGKDADGVLVIEASVGAGKLYLLAPQVTFRGQPHATFKLLFNPLHLATAKQN